MGGGPWIGCRRHNRVLLRVLRGSSHCSYIFASRHTSLRDVHCSEVSSKRWEYFFFQFCIALSGIVGV